LLHFSFPTKRLHVLAGDAVPAVGHLAVVAGPALLLLLGVDGVVTVKVSKDIVNRFSFITYLGLRR
jgi:hypothetical protein